MIGYHRDFRHVQKERVPTEIDHVYQRFHGTPS